MTDIQRFIKEDNRAGVIWTFIGRHNPEQFEIIGLDRYSANKVSLTNGRFAINGKGKYARILIVNKNINK